MCIFEVVSEGVGVGVGAGVGVWVVIEPFDSARRRSQSVNHDPIADENRAREIYTLT